MLAITFILVLAAGYLAVIAHHNLHVESIIDRVLYKYIPFVLAVLLVSIAFGIASVKLVLS